MPDPIITSVARFLPPPLRALPWRAHPLDGKLLLLERDTGLNVLLEGEETAHLRRLAPRTLLIGVTNACDLHCPFCNRDRDARSRWRFDTLLAFCQEAERWGVLEVAFGGGEPLLFPRWTELMRELHASTRLGLSFTTNGTHLNERVLEALAGCYGQIRLSLYEDNNWPATVALLGQNGARFGVNWLITPAELDGFDEKLDRLLALGVRDLLLLRYKGVEQLELHLGPAGRRQLADLVTAAHARLDASVTLKIDVCWGDSLDGVPTLFGAGDCGAADEFLSITSDWLIKPCSFHHGGVPFETLSDVRAYWQDRRLLREAAQTAGCARLPGHGLVEPIEIGKIPIRLTPLHP